MRGFLAGLVLLVAVACSQKLTPIDTDIPTPVDGDADADADSDADSDADADVDTGPVLDCTTPYDTPVPGSNTQFPSCVTEQVFCGQTIFATIEGGTTQYDYQFWADNQDLGSLINKPEKVDGPERIYALDALFSGSGVTVTVESCNEVWASWIAMGDLTDYCDEFTQAPKDHFDTVQGRYIQEADIINASIGVYSVQIIVDSNVNAGGNFLMHLECD
ncbi:MAG: hypothetical protein R3F61_38205 [Myxococcota bacterium]